MRKDAVHEELLSLIPNDGSDPIVVYRFVVNLNGGNLAGISNLCSRREDRTVKIPFAGKVVDGFVGWLLHDQSRMTALSLSVIHGLMRLADYYCIDNLRTELDHSFKISGFSHTDKELGTTIALSMKFNYELMLKKCLKEVVNVAADSNFQCIRESFAEQVGSWMLQKCDCFGCESGRKSDASSLGIDNSST